MSMAATVIEEDGPRTLSKVKITQQPGRTQAKQVDTTWEFQCEDCDTMDTGLTEAEARDEFEHHVCPDDREDQF